MSKKAYEKARLEGKGYKDSPDAWQTKVQLYFKLPFPLPWLCLAGGLFALGAFIAIHYGESHDAIRLLAIQCAVLAAITNSVVLFEYLMDQIADTYPLLINENRAKAKEWIYHWYEIIFWSKKNLLIGLLMGLLITVSNGYESAALFHSTPGIIYSFFITFVVAFMGGSCLWTALSIALMFFSMGKDVQIRSSIFDSKSSILRMSSSVLLKVSLVMSLVYLLGISTLYFCDVKVHDFSVVVIAVFGVFIIAYFIVPQVNIHKHLVRLKQSRLRVLVEQIDQSFDRVAEQPSPENISQLRDLFHLQNIVNGKKSWSFGVGELLMLVGSILIPLALFVINYLLRLGRAA